MIIVSHRGYLNGPDPELENNPEHIIRLRTYFHFYVEVDLWKIDNKLFLGHDKPKHEINQDFLAKLHNRLYIHCKNTEALEYMSDLNLNLDFFEFFWHENDSHTVTSSGYIWNHYKNETQVKNSIVLLFDKSQIENLDLKTFSARGVCTDYPVKLNELLAKEKNEYFNPNCWQGHKS